MMAFFGITEVLHRREGGNVAPNRAILITTQSGYIAPAGEQYYDMSISVIIF